MLSPFIKRKINSLLNNLHSENLEELVQLYANSDYSEDFTKALINQTSKCQDLLANLLVHASQDNIYEDIFCYLVQQGVNLDCTFDYHASKSANFLHMAAYQQLDKACKQLLITNPHMQEATDARGKKPVDYSRNKKFFSSEEFILSNLLAQVILPDYRTISSRAETPIPSSDGASNSSWQDVACVPNALWLVKPTGQLQWKSFDGVQSVVQNVANQRWGSGFLISNSLFMTAGHCFDSQNEGWHILDSSSGLPLEPKELAPFIKVVFNYQNQTCGESSTASSIDSSDSSNASVEQEEEFNVLRVVEHRLGGLDYAIVELDGNPGEKYGHVTLFDGRIPMDDDIVVVQHPDGLPKKVDNGPVCETEPGKVSYKLSTDGGSSGSPVGLRSMQAVAAVHTSGFTAGETCNSGVPICDIKVASRILNNSRLGLVIKSPPPPPSKRSEAESRRQYESRGYNRRSFS